MKFVGFWERSLQALSVVTSWIREGYNLPLLYMASPFVQENHGSEFQNRTFVSDAVSCYLTIALGKLVKSTIFVAPCS